MSIRPLLALVLLWLAAATPAMAQSTNVKLYLCGEAPNLVAVVDPQTISQLPNCSEVDGWGLGAWRTGSGSAGAAPGPLRVGAITVQKRRDVNTVALRKLLYDRTVVPRLELLRVATNGPGPQDDRWLTRLRLEQVVVIAARATGSAGPGEDLVELAPARFEINSWDPPGTANAAPTYRYCRNLATATEGC